MKSCIAKGLAETRRPKKENGAWIIQFEVKLLPKEVEFLEVVIFRNFNYYVEIGENILFSIVVNKIGMVYC